MLNGDLKKNAIEKFENAKNTYEKLGIEVGKKSEKLMNLRKMMLITLLLESKPFLVVS